MLDWVFILLCFFANQNLSFRPLAKGQRSTIFKKGFGRMNTLSAISSSAPEWDASLGVWRQNSGPLQSSPLLPSPLYVVGYGSLLFRPGDLLAACSVFDVTIMGRTRAFAQRSTDHRGRPSFPGLVVTLGECAGETCQGRIWLVPPSMASEILAYLDYRERGGYSREIVRVKLLQSTPHHMSGEVAEALVYSATLTNPNYHASPVENTARIIAAAQGVSGANSDYLLSLEDFLSSAGIEDGYMRVLRGQVERNLGFYRLRRFLSVSGRSPPRPLSRIACSLLGWGSGEKNQLTPGAGPGCHPLPATLSTVASVIASFLQTPPAALGEALGEGLAQGTTRALAGGACSGLLLRAQLSGPSSNNLLFLWGQLPHVPSEHPAVTVLDKGVSVIRGVLDAALGHDAVLLLMEGGQVWQMDSNDAAQHMPQFVTKEWVSGVHRCDEDVLKVQAGPTHFAAITKRGLFTWGSGSAALEGWLPPPVHEPGHETESTIRLVDVCCGFNYTVVVDELGEVYSVGKSRNKFGELGRSAAAAASSAAGHLAASLPQRVHLPAAWNDGASRIQWHRLASGWHHVVLSGVRTDGTAVHCAWGRHDMGQYTRPSDQAEGVDPVLLPLPPDVTALHSLWAGSEFTVAADDSGRLWASGWNEHGNLGAGDFTNSSGSTWVPVNTTTSSGEFATVGLPRDALLACGGAHVLLLCAMDNRST